jgi:D-alanyl-D-alanine carboxypeptidase
MISEIGRQFHERNRGIIPGMLLGFNSTVLNVNLSAAYGDSGFGETAAALEPTSPFAIASLSKTLTATAILRLVENDAVELNSPIGNFLDASVLTNLFMFDGADYSSKVTIKHLLNHTSGAYDYGTDEQWMACVGNDLRRSWSSAELLQVAKLKGAHCRPGEKWVYSDTGYLLLALILELITNKTIALATSTLVGFDRIGMTSTYLDGREPAKITNAPKVALYSGNRDLSEVHPSIDNFGGGGHVSTLADMSFFLRALCTGKIFKRGATLTLMQDTVPTPKPFERCGLGLFTLEKYGVLSHGHNGYWGTAMRYYPLWDAVAVISTGSQDLDALELLDSIENCLRAAEGVRQTLQ